MGQLTRIEVSNFKSYKSTQLIDFGQSFFTSIIGPNGAGKSNMMDAISFVLGIKSSHLRSNQLRDLVYRGRIIAEDSDLPSQSDKDPATASVTAFYVKDDGDELRLNRSITTQGTSEYRLNGRLVTAHDYSKALEEENILIKARNFLVFQGDVEAIAAQSPKDLTRLIEQISGSLEYKAEYENLKAEQEKSVESSNVAFGKKRAYNSEIKQYQEQKTEIELHAKKIKERDAIVQTHVIWQLFHYNTAIELNEVKLEAGQAAMGQFKNELQNANEIYDNVKTDHAKALRQLQRHERSIRKLEKLVEEKSMTLVPVEEKIKVVTSNEQRHQSRQKEVQTDITRQSTTVDQLRADLERIDKAATEFEQQQHLISEEMGISLSEEDIRRYSILKEAFNKRSSTEAGLISNIQRQLKTDDYNRSTVSRQVEELQKLTDRVKEEIRDGTLRKDQASARVNQDIQDLDTKKKQLDALITERQKQHDNERQLNDRLQQCLSELIELNADKHESERESRFRETIESLKRLIPGVRGRVSDLCKPKQRKYETAMITVLGRNFDAIIVDTQKTAADCIAYMREQRAGISTFIPLDSVVVKPVSTTLKGMHKQMRLAIDTIDFDPSNERAMQFVCGSAIVCDDMNVAKFLRWEKNVEAKAVTLDGSVIHKGGLMTGGRSNAAPKKKWEDQAVKGLQKLKDNLMAQLAALNKGKINPTVEEALSGEVSGLQARLTYERDELDEITRSVAGKQTELTHAEQQLLVLTPKLMEAEANFDRTSKTLCDLESKVHAIEDEIYAEFCSKIGVVNIRKYEEFRGTVLQEATRRKFQFVAQRSRVINQLKFEEERLAETKDRLNSIETNIERERTLMIQLRSEMVAIQEEINALRVELDTLTTAFDNIKEQVNEKSEEVSKARTEVQRISKDMERRSRTIASMQEEIEKVVALRTNILRNCKLEGVKIPLVHGSLDYIPMGVEALGDRMDSDTITVSQSQADPMDQNYGVEIDFSQLSKHLKEDKSDEAGESLLEQIHTLTSEIEKMTPNMRALDRLGEVEERMDEIDREFDASRKNAKLAKEKFNAVKEKRLDLFNKAYMHISEQIDKIYKELTKSRSFPLGGTAYLTLEDQDEPYLDGVKYHAMPPMKRFRDMDQLSGGEKTMAALALLFAIHSYRPSPFFVLDEVDAALDNANVAKIANYIHDHAGPGFQFIVISLKNALFQRSDALVGIYRAQVENSSRALTLDLREYAEA
ncbi:structural maintenance of chromosomes protein-like protein 1 [Limtongia smithiae]|uniref:structural maintenance of chromosomes protein-like protein 1 n=1 Tax=Limtongia smithiae TaxID=1125753 RepID=UPI0034CD78C2